MADFSSFPLTSVRLLALGVVVLATASGARLPDLAVAFALAHYVVGAWYSRRRVVSVWALPRARVPFVGLVVAATAASVWNFPNAFVWFLVHHALNEAYAFPAWNGGRGDGRLVAFRAGLNATVYAAILRNHPSFAFLSRPFLGVLLVVFGVAVVIRAWRLPREERNDVLAFEGVGGVAMLASMWLASPPQAVLLYHFSFWIFQPLRENFARRAPGSPRYLVQILGATLAFYALTPAGGGLGAIPWATINRVFLVTSYFHITLSFALSPLNPPLIRRLFRDEGAVPAPQARAA